MVQAHTAHSDQNGDAIWAHMAYGCQCVKIDYSSHMPISILHTSVVDVQNSSSLTLGYC